MNLSKRILIVLNFSLFFSLCSCRGLTSINSLKIKAINENFTVSMVMKNPHVTGELKDSLRVAIQNFNIICRISNIGSNIICSEDTTLMTVELSATRVADLKGFLDTLSNSSLILSDFKIKKDADTIILNMLISPTEFSKGEIIIDCPATNKELTPQFNSAFLNVSRVSEDIYKYTVNAESIDYQSITLRYILEPSSGSSNTKDQEKDGGPKEKWWSFILDRGFWLFLFTLLGAFYTSLQVRKYILDERAVKKQKK